MNKHHISFWRLVVPMALLLPLMVPIACTTDAGAGSSDGLPPLVFKVSSDDLSGELTRGERLNFMSGTFGLLASQYTGSWGYGHEMNFMYNEPVWGSGTEWQTSRGYFAPDAMYNLKFFAYFPHYEDVTTGVEPIVMSEADLPGNPSFVYTMPQNAEEQQDLMYAISDEVHANAQGRMDTVRLQFHHLLTAVSFATGNSSEDGYIRRVRLTDIYYRGTFDYGNTAITTSISAKRDCWTDLDLRSRADGSGFYRADPEKTFLILPQRNSNGEAALNPNASLVVEYETSGKIYTFTKSLSALKDALATPGRNILLRLSVTSVKRMTITATITDWGHGANFDGAVSDQPTIDLGTAISDWEDKDSNGQSTTVNFTAGPETTNP